MTKLRLICSLSPYQLLPRRMMLGAEHTGSTLGASIASQNVNRISREMSHQDYFKAEETCRTRPIKKGQIVIEVKTGMILYSERLLRHLTSHLPTFFDEKLTMPEPLGGALHQQAEIIALIAFAIADMSMIKRFEL